MSKSVRKSTAKPSITAEDLYRLRLPTSVSMSPDENRVAYTVERMDKKDNKYYSNIYLCDLKTRKAQQFTHGNYGDGQPVWSPDGVNLAFVSTREKKTGVYLMSSGGGAERRLIEVDGTVSDLGWTPDGENLLFAMRYNDSHFIEDEKKKKKPPVYRHITRLFYRLDAVGFVPKDSFQIYTLEIESKKLRKITRGKRDKLAPAVSSDGRLVAYVSNRSKDPDRENLRDDLFVVPLKGGKERRIPTPAGPVASPAFSPDSKSIAYLGHDNPNDEWGVANFHIWKVGINGRPSARDLMPGFDRAAFDLSIADTGEVAFGGGIKWSGDGKRIFFLCSDTGMTNLFSQPARGGKPTRIFAGKCHIKGFSVSGKSKKAVVIHADLSNPGEVVTIPTVYGGEKKATRLTSLNRFLKSEVILGRTREVRFQSFDGTWVQGWLVHPPNFNPKRRYPSILEIHGGPRVQYGFTFFHEIQYLAAKGYVVFYTNPRGGAGRGETWAASICGGWGGLDYKDCMAAADWMEKQPFVNGRKIGVTGGSYGGYMTNWMIGHTNRFAAAVTQRSVVDLRSFFGSSDIGFDLHREFAGYPWSNAENYEKCSPIAYYKNIKTPVLIIHSEQDLRCGIEQAEQMFAMLKMMGKKVEFVRFPEEPHGLSRHGRPDRRIARLEWIDKWFAKYLKRGK